MADPINLSAEMLHSEVKRLLSENWALTQECLLRGEREDLLIARIQELQALVPEGVTSLPNRRARRAK